MIIILWDVKEFSQFVDRSIVCPVSRLNFYHSDKIVRATVDIGDPCQGPLKRRRVIVSHVDDITHFQVGGLLFPFIAFLKGRHVLSCPPFPEVDC